jgi:hypothetical protein
MSRTRPAIVLVAIFGMVAAAGESDSRFELPATTLTVAPPALYARASSAGYASVDGCQPPTSCVEAAFQEWSTSTQFLAGFYASGLWGPRSRQYNYLPFSVRQGVMATSPEDHWWGRGNYECLFDLTGAWVATNYGNWFAGPTFFARANWVAPDSPVVPYLQAGVGAVYNDAYRDQTQRALGEAIESYLHLQAGLKCFVAPNLSLDVEIGLQHQSNGGLAERNYGINCYGGALGLTYHFPCGDR